jgi:predicted membrane-bound spermidine synthase
MAGIAIGSWLSTRHALENNRTVCRNLATTQCLLGLSAPLLMLLISQLDRISGIAAAWMAAHCIFPALSALCGALGGYQFCIAAQVYLPGDSATSKLGTLYALDLLGGCAGALLLSAYLIPVFGFWKTVWFCAAINMAPALLAMRVSSAASTSATE